MLRNPLMAPDLQEYLHDGLTEAFRDYIEDLHPGRIAELMEDLEELQQGQASSALSLLETRQRGEVITYFPLELQVGVIKSYSPVDAAELLQNMPHDDRADLVNRLDEDEADLILRRLAHAEREDIRRLTSYEPGTAGAVMTTDYASLPPHLRVREAIDQLRREFPDKETINLSYIVDPSRRLMGFISLPTLIRARPQAILEDIMERDVIAVHVEDDQGSVADTIAKYDLFAIPVLNQEEQLVGIVTVDDAMDIRQREEGEDFLAFGGVRSEGEDDVTHYLQRPTFDNVRSRLPPLLILFISGTLTIFVQSLFDNVIQQVSVLAFYVPLLIGTGGNAGSQTVGTVIRALALKQIGIRDALKVAARELTNGLVLGVLLGSAGFLFACIGTLIGSDQDIVSSLAIATVFSLSILGICVWSNVVGSLVPLLAEWLNIDPAVVSAPAISTLVDVTGLLLYYSIALGLIFSGVLG